MLTPLFQRSVRISSILWILLTTLASADALAADKGVPVTMTTAGTKTLEVWQLAQGRLQAKTSPLIAAEVNGRITSVLVDVGQEVSAGQLLAQIDAQDFKLARDLVASDIERLQALINAQQLQVERYQMLVKQKSANQSALDDAEAQLGSLKAQLVGSKVRLQQAQRNIERTDIVSPVSGRVNQRKISKGDYLNVGTPLFQITTLKNLQALLSFPESLASRLQVGQLAKLSSPVMPGQVVESQISEIRPEISASNLAAEILINMDNSVGWEPGASVTGEVLIDKHQDAVVVPEGCVIRRPSGLVVYKITDGKASEVAITTGMHQNNQIEVLTGVQPGDQLALDGAAYLTDGVDVDIKSNATQGAAQ